MRDTLDCMLWACVGLRMSSLRGMRLTRSALLLLHMTLVFTLNSVFDSLGN